MGVTDEVKASSSGKSKPPLPSKPSLNAGTNGPGEGTIPQMVITSAEGVAEEVKLENVNESSAGVEIVSSQDNSQHEKEMEAEEKHTAVQRPLVISGCEESVVSEELSHQDNAKPLESSESTTRTAIQRPLIIENFEASVERSENVNLLSQDLPEVASNTGINNDVSAEPSDNLSLLLEMLPELAPIFDNGCDGMEMAISNYHDDALSMKTSESTPQTVIQRPQITAELEQQGNNLNSDGKDNVGAVVEHLKGDLESTPRQNKVSGEAVKDSDGFFSKAKEFLFKPDGKFFHKVTFDDKKIAADSGQHPEKSDFGPSQEQPAVQDLSPKDKERSKGFPWKMDGSFFSHKTHASDDKGTPSGGVEISVPGEGMTMPDQSKIQSETPKDHDGLMSKSKGFPWKMDGSFFSHKTHDKETTSGGIEISTTEEFDPTSDELQGQDEPSKKPDGKFFSFPKFHFGSKEKNESTKDSVLESSEKTSSRPLKVSKKEQKVKIQEYSVEAAEALNDSTRFNESYRKLDADEAPRAPPVILVSEEESGLKIEEMSPVEPYAIPKESKLEEIIKKVKSDKKKQKDQKVEGKNRSEGFFEIPLESKDEDVARKEDLNKKEHKKAKDKLDDIKGAKNTGHDAPDTLYETCCLKLAVLIRNKAIDIVSDHTSKSSPPKKPPKPTAEAIAKARAAVVAKRFEETERHLNFGNNTPAGYDEIRYADDDTESSTDYTDLADLGYIMNPECYGIITKMKSENKMNNFSVPSTCSGLTSYYTAETITLKDENFSDNTLDTVSLGSGDSIVLKPLPLLQEKRNDLMKKDSSKTASASEKTPKVDKKAIPKGGEQKSFGLKSFSIFRLGKQDKYYDAQTTVDPPTQMKKIPPPVPPKPAILLKSKESVINRTTFTESSQGDISSCVNKLSLSPRPFMRSSNGSAGIRKRPLTIAGVKETEFPQYVKKKIPDSAQNKTVLNTVLVNKSLKTMRQLPKEPSPVKRSASCASKSSTSEAADVHTPKKQPPQRPPPPVISPRLQSIPDSSNSYSNVPVINERPEKDVVMLPKRPIPKDPVFPPKPLPPAVKPVIRPPRPPPPTKSPPPKNLPTTFKPEKKSPPEGSLINEKSSFVMFEDSVSTEKMDYYNDTSPPCSMKNSETDTYHYPINADDKTQSKLADIECVTISERPSEHDSRPLNIVGYTSSKKESVSFETSASDSHFISEKESMNQSPIIFNLLENKMSSSEVKEHTEQFDVCDTTDQTSTINYHDIVIHSPVCDNVVTENVADNDLEHDSFEEIPKVTPRKPRPPPRIRRKRSRTVEIVPVTWKPIDRRRRSQSLTDIDVKKRTASGENCIDREKPELKALYTAVHKDPIKSKTISVSAENGLERKFPSLESVSSRPLPAPPPPPRSKSRSTSRRSKSDERPHVADIFEDSTTGTGIVDDSTSVTDNSKPQIKPPIRRKKVNKRRFLSLGSADQPECSFSFCGGQMKAEQCDNSLHDKAPIKPERRAKTVQVEVHFDENANIADSTTNNFYSNSSNLNDVASSYRKRTHSADCNANPKELPEKKKLSPLHRSRSENAHKKSYSSWYDESDASSDLGDVDTLPCSKESLDKLDTNPNSNELCTNELAFSKQKQTKLKADSAKKPRQTSKFYVDVGFPEVLTDADSIDIYSGKEDKETSPLPLECSEKSVQTSLETLSRGVTSQGEQSEDTDDLLDLAQTLQDELKTIINRHKHGEHTESGSDDTHSQDQSFLSLSHLKGSKLHGSRSSTSEVWQMTSSEDSDPELGHHRETNLTELAIARKKKKIFYIAQEIMSSEEAFVDALKLLNMDFKAAVENASKQRGAPVIPDEVLNQILNHLPQLQHLNDNLLQELKDRINQWEKNSKIADIIVKMGPFLKLYSWYIQDFEATTTLLEESKKKYPAFWQVVKEFEVSSRCKRLTLNHYMLKPVQRIPQYRLLLQEYLHQLPHDSVDYEDTVEALRIVSDVAKHANESMKQGDNFQKLISIQSSILGQKEIIKPGRTFIKEGELMKLSRKGMQPRWFVLLNDLLLYLTPVQQGLYRINHELILVGMKVAIPIQQDYQNEFSIISVTRSFTLAAKSPEERQEWIVALTKAIEENASKRSTFTNVRLQQKSQLVAEDYDDGTFILGKKAPVWIPDARVTMCQLCTSEFTVTFRRHHCRACGKVVCSICSSNRISLQYLGNRIARVCDECYSKLGQGSSGCTESGETDSDNQQIAIKSHLRTDHKHNRKTKRQLPSVLKEVCANDQGSSISGYVQKKINKSWKRNWFVLKDKVLYEYKASEDVAALRSIPLLGYQIEIFAEPLEGVDPSLLFQVSHPGQAPVVFHAETPGSAERWIRALKEATILE